MTTRKDPFEINLLLDAYETLLTPKQQEVMRLHYREDFSLSEISEALSISRAGALDHIRRASDSLYDYEQRLHLLSRNAELRTLLPALRVHCDRQGQVIIDQLEDLIS